MIATVAVKAPELKPIWGNPIWFHHHGIKFSVSASENDELVLDASAAHVHIKRYKRDDYRGWSVSWQVRYSRSERTEGTVVINDAAFASAFDLVAPKDNMRDGWLIERYGGDAAYQGCFIRWGRFLNIPCPGTGHDGDPNVSIYISDDILIAVRALLQHHTNPKAKT